MMSSKCGLNMIFMSIIFIIIVNGYAKDISGVERAHKRLNEYISHYETLNYDHEHIIASHNRARRSVTKDHYVHLKFSAHGRNFHLRLKRDLNTFSDKLEFYDSNGPIDVSTDHIYEGEVIGDRNSYVFGSIHNGVFEGKIITERDAYFVEHAKHYFPINRTKTTTTPATVTTSQQHSKTRRTKTPSIGNSSISRDGRRHKTTSDSKRHALPETMALRSSAATTDEDDVNVDVVDNDDSNQQQQAQAAVEERHDNNTNKNFVVVTTTTMATTASSAAGTEAHDKVVVGKNNTNNKKHGHIDEDDIDDDDDDNNNNNDDDVKNNNGNAAEDGNDKNVGLDFHSVIYKDSHVDDAYENVREGHVGGCGITEEVSQWMENIQNSAVEELPVPMSKDVQRLHKKRNNPNENNDGNDNNNAKANKISNASSATQAESTPPAAQASAASHPPKKYTPSINDDDFKYPYQKYSKDANFRYEDEASAASSAAAAAAAAGAGAFYDPETGRRLGSPAINEDWHERVHERIRRASGAAGNGGSSGGGSNGSGNGGTSGRREDNKNTCSLYIQTDPLIWRHIREGIADHNHKGPNYEIDVKTREEITSLIAHHVTAVNYIYRNTKFDGRTEHRNIRFEVQRIKIDDDSACRNSYNGPHNAFCNEHMDVSNFLNLHSLEDHSDFCLAYVFTYRDFTGGTLGLAWVASASGASGGICEKYKTYTETVGGQYQSTKRSLNTGIITFVNYNSRVPPKVSQLTLAHEIGHNFGSPHDYPQECRPGGLNGNYIMFASATSGDRPNNSKFSPCSIRNISNVLDVLVGNQKRDCFKVSEGAFCGNKIVELGEECDCGFNDDECKDNCCYPRLISEYDQSLNSSAKGCTRRAKTQCSPSQGPCCVAQSCAFVSPHVHQKCKEESECSWSSTCNGTTAECPEPKHRDDKTMCNNGTMLCIRGECTGSPCLLWNMTKCFLSSTTLPHISKRKLCELACQDGNDPNTCRSTSEFAEKYGIQPGGISLQPGSPCDNFQGYCDVFLKCRAVDADGPLVRLKNLLLNRQTLLTVAEWVTANWYLVVLMGVAFIVVMGAFIKCCAVHTPSSNPKKRRARRISETLRAPMNTLRRMQRHPHQRGGGGGGPRSIPPPAHEQQHYRGGGGGGGAPHHQRGGGGGGGGRHAPQTDWDRHAGGHSIVPLPTGGSQASRAAAAQHSRRADGRGGRPSGAQRPASGTRATHSGHGAGHGGHGGHGYAEQQPTMSVGIGGGVTAAISSGGVVARAQLPLPMPPTATSSSSAAAAAVALNTALQQQQQQQQHPLPQQTQQQQAFYAPKVVVPPQQVNYNRPPSLHVAVAAAAAGIGHQPQHLQQHPQDHGYADAYAALGRGAYEATARAVPQSLPPSQSLLTASTAAGATTATTASAVIGGGNKV